MSHLIWRDDRQNPDKMHTLRGKVAAVAAAAGFDLVTAAAKTESKRAGGRRTDDALRSRVHEIGI